MDNNNKRPPFFMTERKTSSTLEELVAKIYASGIVPEIKIPTAEEVKRGDQDITEKIHQPPPDWLIKKWQKQKQLIEESNQLPSGEVDHLGRLHWAMNGRGEAATRARINIFDADLDYGIKKKRAQRKKKGDWGNWRNQTRAEFADVFHEKAVVPNINRDLTDAELQSPQPK